MKNWDVSTRAERLAHWQRYGATLPRETIDGWASYAQTLPKEQIDDLYSRLKHYAAPPPPPPPDDPPGYFKLAEHDEAVKEINRFWQEQNSEAGKSYLQTLLDYATTHPVKPYEYKLPSWDEMNAAIDREINRTYGLIISIVVAVGLLFISLFGMLNGSAVITVCGFSAVGILCSVAGRNYAKLRTEPELKFR